jgi:UDP-GlcNAc:undecaprenyl-phosphate/decaprenyl-phosphate GlcNAc-1-phosphate transferase
MSEYVITLLVAAAVTYILTPAVRRFAVAVGAMHAARERDVHEMPTPLLGGFAIYGGLAAALLLASRLSGLKSVFAETNMAKGLLLAGALLVIMGFVDDRWGMGALSKLAGQVAAGVILVWSGAEITWLPEPGGVALILTSDQQVAVTILVVVVTINAVNFIDGLDGLAAGIVGIGAVAFFAYYFTLIHRLGLLGQSQPALASALLAGVCLGFLPHNFHPARIFMGDTGSMLIGLMLAYAPISSLALLDPYSLTDTAAYQAGTVNRYGAFIPLLVPAAILLIPYADLLMAVVRRTRAGKSVFAPDKKHLQHRLLAIGHSHRTSVLIMYLWAALFSGSVILLSIVRTPLFVLAIVTVVAVLGLLLVTMPRLRPWSRAAAGYGVADYPAPRRPAPGHTVPANFAPANSAPANSAPVRAVPANAVPVGGVPAGAPPDTARGNVDEAAGSPDEAGWHETRRPASGNGAPGNRAAGSGAPANGAPGSRPAGSGALGAGGTGAGAEGSGAPGNGAVPDHGVPTTTSLEGTGRAARPGGPWQAASAVAPWEAGAALPSRTGGRAVPPWEAGAVLPSRTGGRAVPPWEAASAEGTEATGLAPEPPWPGADGSLAGEGPDESGTGQAAPPWQPASRPQTPGSPPWPPAAPPRR